MYVDYVITAQRDVQSKLLLCEMSVLLLLILLQATVSTMRRHSKGRSKQETCNSSSSRKSSQSWTATSTGTKSASCYIDASSGCSMLRRSSQHDAARQWCLQQHSLQQLTASVIKNVTTLCLVH
jgi:hypothetical protein